MVRQGPNSYTPLVNRSLWLWLGSLIAVAAVAILIVKLWPEPAPLDSTVGFERPDAVREGPPPREEPATPPPAPPPDEPREPSTTAPPGQTPPPASAAKSEPPLLDKAKAELRKLQALLKSRRSANEEILAALDATWGWYLDPSPVRLHAMPEAGSPPARTVAEANLRLLTEPQDVQSLPPREQKFWREFGKFRKDVEKTFLKAFTLVNVHEQPGRNAREDVNIRAVTLLGMMEGSQVSKGVCDRLERRILRAKYEVQMELYRAAFGALARLNDMESFDWMTDEFTHARASPQSFTDQLLAAHEAIVRFQNVPGRRRHELVIEMVKTYSAVEALAEARQDAALWARIGPGVLRVVEHYAGRPRDPQGRKIRTMRGYQEWFREHKNPKRPPWTD